MNSPRLIGKIKLTPAPLNRVVLLDQATWQQRALVDCVYAQMNAEADQRKIDKAVRSTLADMMSAGQGTAMVGYGL